MYAASRTRHRCDFNRATDGTQSIAHVREPCAIGSALDIEPVSWRIPASRLCRRCTESMHWF
jgi:hypothetical protein